MKKYKILIYGCGDLGKKFFARLSDKYTIAGFIDEKAEMLREVNNAYEIFSLKQAACVGSKNEYIVIVALHDGMQHDMVAANLYKMGYDKIIYSPMKLTISYSYRQQMKNIYRSAFNGTIISMEKVLQQRKFHYGCEIYSSEKIIDIGESTVSFWCDVNLVMLEIEGKMCKLERFQPYVDLFRWLKGEKDVPLEAYIEVVKRTKKNIDLREWLHSREKLYDLYVDALKYDTTFFTEVPSPCSWHEAECKFCLNEGMTRGMFLISNNYECIPISVAMEDFTGYIEWKGKNNFE